MGKGKANWNKLIFKSILTRRQHRIGKWPCSDRQAAARLAGG